MPEQVLAHPGTPPGPRSLLLWDSTAATEAGPAAEELAVAVFCQARLVWYRSAFSFAGGGGGAWAPTSALPTPSASSEARRSMVASATLERVPVVPFSLRRVT